MADKKPVDVPDGRAVPLGPLDPVEHQQLSAMGGTFAERQAAREAAEAKASGKQVAADSAENKSVSGKRASKK